MSTETRVIISMKEKRRLERLKKELENQQNKLNTDKKQYLLQMKELKAEKKKVNTQKKELDIKTKKLSMSKSTKHNKSQNNLTIKSRSNRAKSLPKEIETKLRQEIKELKSESNTNKDHLNTACNEIKVLRQRLRSYTMDSTSDWKYEKLPLIQRENHNIDKNTINKRTETLLKVIDALHNEPHNSLDEIIQNIDKNEDDEQWKKALNELSTLEIDSSEFKLCHELLHEMVLRQQDLEQITQYDGNDIDTMYASITSRHMMAMHKIQDINKDKDLLKHITDNNKKWLKDVKQLMVQHSAESGEEMKVNGQIINHVDEDEKSYDGSNPNAELESIFKEILLNESQDPEAEEFTDIVINIRDSSLSQVKEDAILLVDTMEIKYNSICGKYDELKLAFVKKEKECKELKDGYSQLKDESELLVQYEKEYTALLQEYLRYKERYCEREKEYNKLKNAHSVSLEKANHRTDKLQSMYQTEYENVLQELIEYRQKEEDMISKYRKLQREYNNKCEECMNCKMNHSSITAAHHRMKKEYDNIAGFNKELQQQITDYKRMENEYLEKKNEYIVMENEYKSLSVQYKSGQEQYKSKCMEYEKVKEKIKVYKSIEIKYNNKCKECNDYKEDLNKMMEKQSKLKDEYDILMNEMNELQNELIEYKKIENKYKNMEWKYSVLKTETTAKCSKLEKDYGILYNELTQTKTTNKYKTQQLEELYQSEYNNLLKEFTQYKQESNTNESNTNHYTKQIQELKKQNKFMKQNQIQIQQIYEAEYEKLLKEFKQYKQSNQLI